MPKTENKEPKAKKVLTAADIPATDFASIYTVSGIAGGCKTLSKASRIARIASKVQADAATPYTVTRVSGSVSEPLVTFVKGKEA